MTYRWQLGDQFRYPQTSDGKWPEGGITEKQWFDAEARARRDGLRLHDTGSGYVVVEIK